MSSSQLIGILYGRDSVKVRYYHYLWLIFTDFRLNWTVINWLLQHEPDQRPSAIELSQSPLMPPRMEDEYFKGALRLMGELIFYLYFAY